ncbi:uncharacterized protein EI90DRAFT_3047036 [Cantharellus anzutake]|uniref:uncharacterized protein n=1 Tax=Cantharellus anzutake TaxID=1750568 RepID=UPI0019083452|nr:uncharacterized protein EI90DRAFT_3047036 [Cantharellus anzutake]KAF8335754.1 hypothetical protein EI90DRAFT_3047036 [Cantharellus anzutake]
MAPSNARRSSGTPRHTSATESRDDEPFESVLAGNTAEAHEIFIDPMLGQPLLFFVHEDVPHQTSVVEAIKNHGGTVLRSYSQATYIIVNPSTPGGKSLWRLYHGKKVKVLLEAEWVSACIRAGGLQSMTYANNWGGFQVTNIPNADKSSSVENSEPPILAASDKDVQQTSSITNGMQPKPKGAPTVLAGELPPAPQTSDTSRSAQFLNSQDHPQSFHGLSRWPSLSFGSSSNLATSSMLGQFTVGTQWDNSNPSDFVSPNSAEEGPTTSSFPLPSTWTEEHNRPFSPIMYYHEYGYGVASTHDANSPHTYEHTGSSRTSLSALLNSSPPTSTTPQKKQSETRKRKRTSENTFDASVFVRAPDPSRRSPTPPRTIVSSLHGGNTFTSEDVSFLHRYIEYCRDKGLMLSLREICERLAIKAPHHSFFSWRRFCNKNKIRLGSYTMETTHDSSSVKEPSSAHAEPVPEAKVEKSEFPGGNHRDPHHQATTLSESSEDNLSVSDIEEGTEWASQPEISAADPDLPGPTHTFSSEGYSAPSNNLSIRFSGELQNADGETFFQLEDPRPPTSLFRSSTGKGIAFTSDDVEYLLRFMSYRKHQDGATLNMVQFWKDVAETAPHHSRASWMKYWRRHKHELEGDRGDIVAPMPPSKRSRYTREDDMLLAHFFAAQHAEDSQDNLFRLFASEHPHHPWKGWQERYRTHRAEILHMIDLIRQGEDLDDELDAL